MRFSDHLFQKIQPIYEKILEHPFIRELSLGTLSKERFHFFLEQDAYYLVFFSKALSLIAGRASSSEIIHAFSQFSLDALLAERQLHAHFLQEIDKKIDPTLSCIAYTRFLIATAVAASIEEAMAAILPCFWIYREVGLHLLKTKKEHNPYALWIDTYSSPDFSEATTHCIALFDTMASKSSSSLLLQMELAFEYSAIFEWHFWNDAYDKQSFLSLNRIPHCSIPIFSIDTD